MASAEEVLQALGVGVGLFNPAAGATIAAGGTALGFLGGLISGDTPSVSSITAQQQAALSGGFGGPVTSTGTSVGPPVVFSQQPIQAGLGQAAVAVARRLAPVIAGGAIVEGGSRALIPPMERGMPTRRQLILAQARGFSPGATAKKIIRSARQCGIELAAATFGLNVLDVCFLIAQPATRRARGISAADLRRTRSTLRKVANIQHDLGHLKSPIRRTRRK